MPRRVGPAAMADWLQHFLALAAYTMLNWGGQILCHWTDNFNELPLRQRYVVHRLLDAWEYGSGADYKP